MGDTVEQSPQSRRPHPQQMAAPYLEFQLGREIEQLHREPEWTSGQNARTLAKYDDLRVVLMALKSGAKVAAHKAGGRVTIHAVEGHVQLRAEGRTFDMPAGTVLAFDRGIVHEVEAFADSALLITIAWAPR